MVQRLHASHKLRMFTNRLEPRSSLQSSFVLLAQNMKMLQDTLSNNSAFLSSAHVYPNPHFPAQTQEPMLQMLLRKKLDPTAEDWVLEGRKEAARMKGEESGFAAKGDENKLAEAGNETAGQEQSVRLTPGEWNDLWSWAGPVENEMAQKMLSEETLRDFTFEEQEQGVENVVTGLRRKLWESDSEDEDDEDAKMDTEEKASGAEERVNEPTKPMVPMDTIFRFMSTGKLPAPSSMSYHIQGS
ncbi:MAG: mediator of RNA polymerase II transcription subunit 8 [Bathelium mastoideum]|nr:MAG: mediator of RNA polymerase II transcription subunit 8 [Bathelium mastoideum]KAI9690470.1 MAG: mediator of RNA polymerase II transcription subunit 8 [Bathelium mastoideum]